MKKHFQNYENSETLAISTIVDPRFKKLGFRERINYDEGVKTLKANIASTKCSLCKQYNVHDDVLSQNFTSQSMWQEFDEEAGSLIAATKTHLNIRQIENISAPHFTIMLSIFFCNVATSVPCERIFSKTGNILTEKRKRLKSKKVSQIVFINYNS